uniref:Putative secreted peptide n=1 Tax=Anopheles braziliensis TaxID=58242 RepID=A0A2M3ZEF6_9DIPT
MAHKMKLFSTVLLMALVVLSVVHLTRQASVSLQVLSRAERSTPNQTLEKKCETNSPCGWAIYSTVTRYIEKFEKNTCDCPKPLLCIRMEDDIATGTFVYRCRDASNGLVS